MPTGISLHIGVSQYNRNSYRSCHHTLITNLPNCHRDAAAKQAIAERFHFKSAILLNEKATLDAVINGIGTAVQHLQYGDIFFLSFSGHGSRICDRSGDEDDGYDETWCLHDRMLIDDELFNLLKLFRPGVRIVVIADSCHSGTSIKDIYTEEDRPGGKFPVQKTDDIQAKGLLLAACQDKQTAFAGNNINYSVYTYWMLQVLKEYDFCNSYRELHNRISNRMPKSSTPNLFAIGPGGDQFIKTRPFMI